MALAEKELGTQSKMGGWFQGGFLKMIEPFEEGFEIVITDDPSSPNPNATVANPLGGAVLTLETRRAKELELPLLACFLGKVEHGLETLSRISAVVARNHKHLVSWGSIDGTLRTDGFTRIECLMQIRLKNTRQPKQYFGS